ncbi:hypothetical protein HXY33_08685 [Candidatus Bathyarchaeota archaeon]|nr:hypothetical protein [Candidatus Bathyarchaeota archaeon]
MSTHGKANTKELALVSSFTALYIVFGAIKISPIIGLPGQAITAAAILAPMMGIIFGPYISVAATFLGGMIGISLGYFSQLSFASGIAAALCSGLTSRGKRIISMIVYLVLFLLLAFFPVVGPAWLFMPYLWFQIIGFIILILPLQSTAIKNFDSNNSSRLFYAFFVTSLTSTLAGQMAGSATYELIVYPDTVGATGTWITTAFLYPIERVIIAIGSAVIGTALFKVLKTANLVPSLNRPHRQEKYS